MGHRETEEEAGRQVGKPSREKMSVNVTVTMAVETGESAFSVYGAGRTERVFSGTAVGGEERRVMIKVVS